MPLMVGLPNVGRGRAAVDADRWPTDGRRRSAVSPAIANLAHGEVLARATGSSLLPTPAPRRPRQSFPATTRRGSLLRRCNTPREGVSTGFARILPRPAVDTPARGWLLSGGGIRGSRHPARPPRAGPPRGA